MANPVRFPSGVATALPKQLLSTFPKVGSVDQSIVENEFLPYRAATDFTVTQTNGTAAAFSFNTGAVKIATTTAAADKSILAMGPTGNLMLGAMFNPGAPNWFNMAIAMEKSTVNDATATVVRWGLFDVADISGTITNGVYFEKATNSSGQVNLVIKNNASGSVVTTTINKVADASLPSGIFGDAITLNGTLTTTGTNPSGYQSVAVGVAGSGYVQPPLVLAKGATGTNAQLSAKLGSTALYAPYIVAPGSAYTTFTNEVDPVNSYQFYFDGQTFYVGVNGKMTASIGPQGVTPLAAGATVDATVSNSYVSTSTLSTLFSPVQPKPGSAFTILPTLPLAPVVGITNASAAGKAIYVTRIQAGYQLQ